MHTSPPAKGPSPTVNHNPAKSKRRRRNGAGHVYQRGDRWVAVFRFPGRANAVHRTCTSKDAAELLLREVEAEKARALLEGRPAIVPGEGSRRAPRLDKERRTFAWLAERYQDAHRSLGPGTWRNRRPILLKHLLPAFGHDPIAAIDLDDLENYRESKLDPDAEMPVAIVVSKKGEDQLREERWVCEPLAPMTVNHHISLLKIIFDWAVAKDYVPASPARYLKLINVDEDHGRPVPSLEQVTALLDAIHDPEKRALVHTVARFGLRIGEALGLPADPFDNEYPSAIFIRQAVHVLEKGGVALGMPKTQAGQRLLPAQAWRDSVYREQLSRLADGRQNPHGLLFPAANGQPRNPNNARRDILKPALRAAGLPGWWGWHDLRRGFITAAYRAGVETKVISSQAGHTDTRTTQRYNKVSAARLFEDAYDPFAER